MRDWPELWVLRHGETEWNAAGRLQGGRDSPLTALGLAQAKAQRSILQEVLPRGVAAWSSPAPRAMRTAEIALDGLVDDILAKPGLVEVALGAWQGRQIEEVFAEHPDLAAGDPFLWKFSAPGGERLTEMVARVEAALARLDGPTVIVTHGITSRVLRCLVLGVPVEDMAILPGGQGVVHHVRDGHAEVLRA